MALLGLIRYKRCESKRAPVRTLMRNLDLMQRARPLALDSTLIGGRCAPIVQAVAGVASLTITARFQPPAAMRFPEPIRAETRTATAGMTNGAASPMAHQQIGSKPWCLVTPSTPDPLEGDLQSTQAIHRCRIDCSPRWFD